MPTHGLGWFAGRFSIRRQHADNASIAYAHAVRYYITQSLSPFLPSRAIYAVLRATIFLKHTESSDTQNGASRIASISRHQFSHQVLVVDHGSQVWSGVTLALLFPDFPLWFFYRGVIDGLGELWDSLTMQNMQR